MAEAPRSVEARCHVNDFEKLARFWHSVGTRDRVELLFETAAMICRYANYGICVSPDPKPPDPRQTEMDLKGGSIGRRTVKILVNW